ncbi:MAG: hypothetical protein LBD16_00470 [Oscillospiraceae bacterium]|jgi:hypothetical protein|nr:hypothetical protein [Oscillospiraceae bacterium]
MDNFHEEIVVQKNRALNDILYGFLTVMMFLFLLITAFLISTIMTGISVPIIIILVVSAGLAALIWWKRDLLKTEYEYTITNSELEFARVMNNSKRKNLGAMNLRKVDAMGYVTGKGFQRYISMPGIKKSNWFLNSGANLFYLYFVKDGVKKIIVIEPSEELVSMIRPWAQQGAWID